MRATSEIAAAAPPTTPPIIAPVWLCFAESGPSVVCGVGKIAVGLGAYFDVDDDDVDEVDELECVSEDVLCEDIPEEVPEDAEEVEVEDPGEVEEEGEGGIIDESVPEVDRELV